MNSSVSETTQLLLDWAGGDPQALEALTPHVYRELKRLARSFLKAERNGHTLDPTALVHEVYIRLVDVNNVRWEGKTHFYALCANMMRRILVDAARKRSAARHGGGAARISLGDLPDLGSQADRKLIALNDALEELNVVDPRKGRLVELRYFGGLSVGETAAVLKVSPETITRDWRFAKGWLLSRLGTGSI